MINYVHKIVRTVLMLVLATGMNWSNLNAQGGGELPTRDQIEAKYKWNLTDIYESDEAWEADFKLMESKVDEYGQFEGKIGNSAADLLACLKFDDEVGITFGQMALYSSLAKDRDLNNTKYKAMFDRLIALSSKVSAAGSYIQPEILKIPEDKLWGFVKEEAELQVYTQMLKDMLRTKEHTLSKELEELMALSGPVRGVPGDAFSMYKNADIDYPMVKAEDSDEEIKISDGRYYAALYSNDRDFRERVYRGYYEPYMKNKNLLASLFNGNIKAGMFNATARKYDNTRQAALDRNNIPLSVYDNLVKTARDNAEPLHRWCGLKKKVLGLDDMHAYDTYVTLFPSVTKEYTYDEGVELCLKALAPLGEEYINNLKMAFENRWIDVYETKGKRTGAYSSGTTYGKHPYVLLNWNGQLSDVFTLAHEMGHNMHSYLTATNQPYPYANYSIFVAEVASTINEALLLDYLIQNAKSKEEKLALIEKNLSQMTFTFYRQTRFAEFEQAAHERTEKGEALTPDILSEMYGEMYKNYWGPDMVVDEEENYTWARIPHFYYNFYVYQYATSFAASQALVAQVKEEGQPAIDRIINFLSSGSSKYPIDVLKDAGVDMNSPEVVLAVVKKMNKLLDQMEELLED